MILPRGLRRRSPPLREERGFTLIELMLASGLFAVVMVIFFSMVVSVLVNLGRQTDRSQSNDQARLAIEELDREIRSGNLLYDPASEIGPVGSDIVAGMALRIYTQTNADTRDPGNRCVQWRITSEKTLQRRDWTDTWEVDGLVSPWRVVAEDVVNRTLSPAVTAFSLDPNSSGRTLVVTIAANAGSGQGSRIQLSVTGRNTQYGFPSNICSVIPPY